MPRTHEVNPSSIPDCRFEDCDRKVVTVESTADYEETRKAEYRFPGCGFIPPQAHEVEMILLGWDVTETCSAGHDMTFYRYRDGHETTAQGPSRIYIEFRKESA